jgi:TatD DNase family protein
MLPHPELALARAAFHKISFVVTVVDPTENPFFTYNNLSTWLELAAGLLDQWDSVADLPRCRVIIGCHPHNAASYDRAAEEEMIKCLKDARTAAIGEIGLDYHYDASPRYVQRQVFRRQLAIAHEYQLPVALHLRESHEDGLTILDTEGWPEAGVLLHCYTLGPTELLPFLDRGASVAFGGTLTFKKADSLREAARQTATERIMTETDAPFMAPTPLRGTLCGPEHTRFTAACLAEVCGVMSGGNTSDFLTEIYHNALRFFDR